MPQITLRHPSRNQMRDGLLVVAILAVCCIETRALDIHLIQAPNSATLNPTYDPNLVQLSAIMQAAANYWESIILDNHTVDVTYGYVDLNPGALRGIALVDDDDGVRPTEGRVGLDILGNAANDWYFDPTPTNHSEFNMQQVLYRDLNPVAQGLYYSGTPHDVLEVGYWGNSNGGVTGVDALTVAIHELGHILGLSEGLPNFASQTIDGEYDFDPVFTQLDSYAAKYHGPGPDDRDHLRASDAAMAVGSGNGDRNLPGATDVFAVASVAGWNTIDLPRKDFWGSGQNNWNSALNWPGFRVPDDNDQVHVRNDSDARLISADGFAGNLFIQEESSVDTGPHALRVTDAITIEGLDPGSQASLVVQTGGVVSAQSIHINQGGILVSTAGATVPVEADVIDIDEGGLLIGNGAVQINSELVNDGTISAIAGVSDQLSLLTGPVDLDGTTGGGQVLATLGNLRISANTNDPFDGQMTVGAGRQIQIFGSSFEVGTNASTNAEVRLNGGTLVQPARLTKTISSIDFEHGTLTADGFAQLDGVMRFRDGFSTVINSGARLRINGSAFYDGGQHHGAGELRWDGPVTIEGDTTIDVALANIDGDGSTSLTFENSRLTLNVGQLDEFNNRFDGTMNMSGNRAGIHVNLPANIAWQMDGTMDITGGGLAIFPDSISGSPVEVTGDINLTAVASLSAPAEISGNVSIGAASLLALSGAENTILNVADVSGGGTLLLRSNATLRVQDATTMDTSLINQGRLQPGLSVGSFSVSDDFQQQAGGTLAMEIEGAPLFRQDELFVSGQVELDGTLEIIVLDGVMPTIGLNYTLISTATGVTGQFDTLTVVSENPIFTYDATAFYTNARAGIEFQSVTMFGDFDDDLVLDCTDVDALVAEIASGGMDLEFDLNGDGMITTADLDEWLAAAGTHNVGGPYLPGDADLDGTVDGTDFLTWNDNKFMPVNGWCSGDFNADGVADGQDFLLWNENKFMSSDTNVSPVPEPSAWMGMIVLMVCGGRFSAPLRARSPRR